MQEDDFEELVSKLPTLTKVQMTDLRRRLLFLIDDREAGGVANEDWILHGIVTVLNERGTGHMVPPNFRVKKARSFAGYETQADRVRMVLSSAIPNMSVTDRRAIGVISVRALADYINGWSEVTFDTLMRNVAKIPEALDSAFPGYLSSGMLGFVLKSQREHV